MTTGIYKITNLINGKFYVGSAVDVRRRRYKHLVKLRQGTHHNQHLQRAWIKYGEENFEFSLLSECPRSVLLQQEQHYLDTLEPHYNIALDASTPGLGRRVSEKTRLAISRKLRGHKLSRETRRKISQSRKGKATGKRHPSIGKKISISKLGHPVSEETKKKISKALIGNIPANKGQYYSQRPHAIQRRKRENQT